MTFCREFGMTFTQFLDQPADAMVRWRQMLEAEAEGARMAKRIADLQTRARSH